MNWLVNIDHMLLLYLLAALAVALLALAMTLWQLRKQLKQNQYITRKIEELAQQALRLDPGRDYQLASDKFKKIRRHYEQA